MVYSPEYSMDNLSPSFNVHNTTCQQAHMLTAPISGPNTIATKVWHKLIAQSPSPAEDDLSVRPNPSDNPRARSSRVAPHEAAAPAVAPAAGLGPSQDDFRDPLEIPGYKKKTYVYRHADSRISDAHKLRFPDIIELFRLQLLSVKGLSKSGPASTEYKLKLCGQTPQDARPSILICHPLLDIKVGRLIFKQLTTKSLREQYECHGNDMRGGFQVYLFFLREFLMLGTSMKPLKICMDQDTLVGAQLVSDDHSYQVSTITCGVSFTGDNTIFALTSAHAFEDNGGEHNDSSAWNYDDSTSESGSLDSDGTCSKRFSDVDDDYNWDELEAAAANERQKNALNGSDNAVSSRYSVERHVNCHEIKHSQVWGRPNNLDWATEPNLDWALVEMPNLGVPFEGSFVTPSSLSERAAAIVVATSSGLRRGTLSSIPSYLASSRNSAALTEIWTLTLTDQGMISLPALDFLFPLTVVQSKDIYRKAIAALRSLILTGIEYMAT
jgi:hypothetical protein